jgi:menaquinone-9 beta-reductase
MNSLDIVGGGPAGAAAALAALSETDDVSLVEKSSFPRHKVCGEFLSPDIAGILEGLGVWHDFQQLRPAVIQRAILYLGRRPIQFNLPERAYGLSRYELDRMLLKKLAGTRARVIRDQIRAPWNRSDANKRIIIACGRKPVHRRGPRLFGFKAHFQGPVDDAVQLFFSKSCYVGVSAIENGQTNVCGLATEDLLRIYDFDVDQLLTSSEPLADRVQPLSRTMKWLTTGPVSFESSFESISENSLVYPAGDSLGFVDPFTGTGILNALLTGSMAGRSAARGVPAATYLYDCRRALSRPFLLSSLLRLAAKSALVAFVAPLVPGRWLYRMTRPDCTSRTATQRTF